MKIILGKTAGFCFGVKNAIDKTLEELESSQKVYCLGELVHNKEITEDLVSRGVIFIQDIGKANGKVIIRAHGVPKEVYEKAKEGQIELKDLTCPKVLAIHNLAVKYSSENYYIFLAGQKTHPETIGTISFCGKNSSIIEDTQDIEKAVENFRISKMKHAVLLAQTTINLNKFNYISEELKKHIENIEIRNTICASTAQRQKETEELSKQVDCMIIVGGKHSSNSNKLFEIAKENCENTFFIENKNELPLEKMLSFESFGIMAGAATPLESITDIIYVLNTLRATK